MKKFVIASLCLASLSVDVKAQEQALGRLFLTPDERIAIEHARKKIASVDLVTLNGYVIPNNGKTTAWVNDVPVQADRSSNLQVNQKPGHKPVISMQTESGQRVSVKVGDSVDLQTNSVRTLLESSSATSVNKP